MNAAIELKIILSQIEKRGNETLASAVQDTSFPQQHAFVTDPARDLAAFCTRRAGKSNGLALRFARTMIAHPNCFCPYVALTRPSAENIMWPVLQEMDERYKLGAEFVKSDLTMTLRNGSKLQLFGADMKNFIKRLKGIKTPGAAIDEAQDFGSHIESLVDDVLDPARLDYNGWIAITGTPGPIPQGFFYDITEKQKYGYSLHKWSLFDNPYLPDPREFVRKLKERKGWKDDNPTLLREYYGRWVLDLEALVVKYQSAVNDFSSVPTVAGAWSYIIGVDLGYHDSDAIAVIGWHPKLQSAYLVEEMVESEQGITELANRLSKLVETYSPDRIVMDTGGLGKKVAEEMRTRYGLPILPAQKTEKNAHVELLNDALRTKKFFARSTSRFAEDSKLVKWDYEKSTPDKLVWSDSYHSDIIDAVLYAFRESYHWLHEPAVEKPIVGSAQHYKEQEDEQIKRLEEQLENERNLDAWGQNGNDWQ